MKKARIEVFKDPKEIATYLSELLIELTNKSDISMALSGGSTPEKIYSHLASIPIRWNKIHLFWGDERMVPPYDPQSNFLMVKNSLLDHIIIPEININRIQGENNPISESDRYNELILNSNMGKFDLILLGLGTDGHIASIFPGNINLFETDKVCTPSIHPESKQVRISITGKTINSSAVIVFIVTGKSKSGIINEIINRKGDWQKYPASYANLKNGEIIWLLDTEAASQL